jgi:hypothetical protein
MKRLLAVAIFCFTVVCYLHAQVVDTSVCDVLANPQSFDGKIIRVKGTVTAGFDEFVIRGKACGQSVNAIWLDYPEGTKAKAGPAAVLEFQLARNNPVQVLSISRSIVKLEKNKEFQQFDSLLATPYKGHGMCLSCPRYIVSATLVGRLDGAKNAGIVRDGAGKFVDVNGFGNLNRYNARLVLQSVSDISPQEVDYTKITDATKHDSENQPLAVQPFEALKSAANAFSPNSHAAKQLESVVTAYGKEGEDNGVSVGFGALNEISKDDGAKSNSDSPDGLIFNCGFNTDRLRGDAIVRAMTHIGQHIVDTRSANLALVNTSTFDLEFRAWQTTVLDAIASQQKTFTIPGGYLVWNSAWPNTDREKMVNDSITAFLTEWALLAKNSN